MPTKGTKPTAKPKKMKRSDSVSRGQFGKTVRAIFLVLLLLSMPVATLSSCGEAEKTEPADEGEVIAAAERLIDEAEPWIRLFFTEGGMPLLDGGRQIGVYREVDGEEMAKLGFSRLSDLKAFERRVFSPSTCDVMDAALFSGGGNWKAALIEYTTLEFADGDAGTVFLCLLADPDELPMLPGKGGTYDFSKASVTDNRGDFVKISVPVYGTGKNEGKTVTKILNLRLIDGAWYLDNYPNVVFPDGKK